MATAVVNGAQLKCESGDAPAPLTVTSQQTVTIGNQLAATIADFAPGTNIPTFGTCKVLTLAASGTPTPCAPVTPKPWDAWSYVAGLDHHAARLARQRPPGLHGRGFALHIDCRSRANGHAGHLTRISARSAAQRAEVNCPLRKHAAG